MGMGGQCHTLDALPPGMTQYPLCRRLGRPQGLSGRVHKISPPPEFDPRTVQFVASRYAHCGGEGVEHDSHCSRGMNTPVRAQLCTWRSTELFCHPWRDRFVLLTASSASSLSVAIVRGCPITSAVHRRWRLHGSTQQPTFRYDCLADSTNSSYVYYTGGWPPPRDAPHAIGT
jgi:hypothetical protein